MKHSARRILSTLALTGTMLTTGASYASLINGSFENATGGLPDNWNPSGNMQVISTQGETDGTYALAFSFANLPSNGVISQTFSTLAGTTYKLDFDFGKYSINQPLNVASLDVDVFDGTGFLGSQLLNATVSDSTPGTPNSTDSPSVYSHFQFPFVALSTSTTLRFSDTSDPQVAGGGFDAMLDKVEVAAVPEPALVALCGLGLAGIGYQRRRKPVS